MKSSRSRLTCYRWRDILALTNPVSCPNRTPEQAAHARPGKVDLYEKYIKKNCVKPYMETSNWWNVHWQMSSTRSMYSCWMLHWKTRGWIPIWKMWRISKFIKWNKWTEKRMQTNAFSFLFIRWKIQCIFVIKWLFKARFSYE